MKRLKNAEQKIISICIDVFEICESNDYDNIYDVL